MADDDLRRAVDDERQRRSARTNQREAGLAYSAEAAKKVAAAMEEFLAAMQRAGNPGLRRPAGQWTGRKSWDGFIYPDGTATSYGPKHRRKFHSWAIEVLSDPGREGPLPENGDRWRASVDATARSITQRLARILADNNVTMG